MSRILQIFLCPKLTDPYTTQPPTPSPHPHPMCEQYFSVHCDYYDYYYFPCAVSLLFFYCRAVRKRHWMFNSIGFISTHLFLYVVKLLTVTCNLTGVISLSLCVASIKTWMNTKCHVDYCSTCVTAYCKTCK